MIVRKNYLDQPIINNKITCENIREIATGQRDDYTTACLSSKRQVKTSRKAFANKPSTDINLSKTQLPKMRRSGGFLGRLRGLLLKTGLPLIKNVIKPLSKSVLIPLGLPAAAAAV